MKNITLLIYSLGISFMLSACSSQDTVSDNIKMNTGYFVSTLNDNVDYGCANKRKSIKEDGKFECSSFPISFYMDELKIGQISTIHNDGYVYPQDIIVLEDNVPIYTSEGNMKFLLME